MYSIGSEGPRGARLAIVAEKPANYEIENYQRTGIPRPLVGPSGRDVDELLRRVGTDRSQVYITNAVRHFETVGNPTDADIQAQLPELYRDLASLPNLNCIVAMGSASLLALSNFHLDGILRRRGSILQSFIGIKMIPTVHPSFYFQGEWRYKSIVQHDLAKALEESITPALNLPQRTYYIQPTLQDALEWLNHIRKGQQISFDIETTVKNGVYIRCIAFSIDKKEGFCIPIMQQSRQPYWSLGEECIIWKELQNVFLNQKAIYITQNGMFDCWHLWRHGILTPYMSSGLDTMYMHKLRAPDLPHKLEFLTSIYTREPYYKDESGKWEDYTVPNRQLWIYNCKDACVTLEIAEVLEKELHKHNMLTHYREEVQAQWDVLMDMQQRGIRVDVNELMQTRASLKALVQHHETELNTKLGWVPNTRSYIDMGKLYNQLGIRDYGVTAKGRPKTAENMLYKLAANYPLHRDIFIACININEARTDRSNFTQLILDKDHYYHGMYNLEGARTGRLSGEGSNDPDDGAAGGGPQPQNIPLHRRVSFIPDKGQEFTGADLKQAEAMLVAWYAQDPLLIEAFSKGVDVHRVRGCIIFRDWNLPYLPPPELLQSIKIVCDKCRLKGEAKCNHSERYLSKESGLAFPYRMGVLRFMAEMASRQVFIDKQDAETYKSKIVSPQIDAWQRTTAASMHNSPWVTTPLGRKREFYGLLDDHMINAVLNHYCQSVIGQITNRAMVKLHRWFKERQMNARIVTQTHDALLVSHYSTDRSKICSLLKQAFYCPIEIHGRTLNIPLEFSHGPNWRDLKETT